MEETEKQAEEVKEAEEPKSEGKAKKWIGGAILLVVLLVIGVYIVDTIQKNKKKEAVKDAAVAVGSEIVNDAIQKAEEEDARNEAIKDAVKEKGTEVVNEVIDEALEGAGVVSFEVEGSNNYEFSPASMSVSPGDKVVLTFMVTEGTHDFVIDELDVATDVISAGEEVTVSFTAPDEPGEYSYYCSVGNHRSLGMEGVLTVE